MIELSSGSDKSKFASESKLHRVGEAPTPNPSEQRPRLKPEHWPVYKGASFDLWDPDRGIYYASVEASKIVRHLQSKRLTSHGTKSSAFSLLDVEEVSDPDTLPCLRPRIAYRDITNPTNTRTIIAALVPGNLVLADQAPYFLQVAGNAKHEALLLGYLSSMILDWYARRVTELHLKFYLLNNFPIPSIAPDESPLAARVVEVAGRLAAVDQRYAEWAADVGVRVGSANDPAVKEDLIHELDACVAHLYGLDEDDLEVLYTTFDEKRPDRYRDRHAAVLKHFRKWQLRVDDTGGAAGGRT